MVKTNNVYDFEKKNQYTRFGRLLRRTSLDELPQLINVLRGEMSFIGPRPWIPDYYNSMNIHQRHRYDVRPGITGLAQVKGRNSLSVIDKINYDLVYVHDVSLKHDLKIVILTFCALFEKDNSVASKTTVKNELQFLDEESALNV